MSYEGMSPLRPPHGPSRTEDQVVQPAPWGPAVLERLLTAGQTLWRSGTALADGYTTVVTSHDGLPTYTCVLPREKESAPLARKLVATLLSEWGLPDLVDDAALVLDELVANSADHARGALIQVTITRKDHAQVRLAVVDMEPKHPRLVIADTEDESGRGMHLIAEISQRWGVDTLNSGKRVWADVAVAS